MSLSRLATKCQACPFADACDNKEMEALGFLPLPEQASQPTETGYRNVENIWDNPKFLIGSDHSSGGIIRTSGGIDTDVEKLIQTITKAVQLSELRDMKNTS